jgi:RNA polymerase sigma-32 factor
MINWNAQRYEPIDATTERHLALAAQKGDKQAQHRLVECNMKLASKIANEYRNYNLANMGDLVQEATLGLCEAVNRYDPDHGNRFTTYAAWGIRSRVLRFIIQNFSMVQIGKTEATRKLFFRLRREEDKLAREGLEATSAIMAERLDVRESDVDEMRTILACPEASMDANTQHGSSTRNRHDKIADVRSTPEEVVQAKQDQAFVLARMVEFEQTLKDKEKVVWDHRIAAENPATAQTVGDLLGCTRQYISQKEASLRDRFVRYARAHMLKATATA